MITWFFYFIFGRKCFCRIYVQSSEQRSWLNAETEKKCHEGKLGESWA
jgi:hypothetical protein